MTATIGRPGVQGNRPGSHGPNSSTQAETMPWRFTLELLNLHQQQPGRGRVQFHGDRLNTVLLWAVEAGWTPTTLGVALGISRQAVSARIAIARDNPSASSIPIPKAEH